MKRISLIAALLLGILLLQSCKKDIVTATSTSTSTKLFFAVINDTTWTADTLRATVTYDPTTKTKVFACSALTADKEISLAMTQKGAGGTTGFATGAYSVDSTTNVALSYYTKQRNSSGNVVFTPQGIVKPGSGTVYVSVVDSVAKVITGSFSFTTLRNNYDSNGNIVSVTLNQVQGGTFNNLPYTFKSN